MTFHLIYQDDEGGRLIVVEIEQDANGKPIRKEPVAAATCLSEARERIEIRLLELGVAPSVAWLDSHQSVDAFLHTCPHVEREMNADLAAEQANASPNGVAH